VRACAIIAHRDIDRGKSRRARFVIPNDEVARPVRSLRKSQAIDDAEIRATDDKLGMPFFANLARHMLQLSFQSPNALRQASEGLVIVVLSFVVKRTVSVAVVTSALLGSCTER